MKTVTPVHNVPILTAEQRAGDFAELVRAEARAAGVEVVGIARIDDFGDANGAALDAFVEAGWHGDMAWLADTRVRRRHPTAMWPEARSAIVVATSYRPEFDPLEVLRQPHRGAISVYAQSRDYHDVIKPRLKQIAGALQRASGADVKVFVDTAPLMEKPLAQLARIGWQGKHTNLVSRDHGSWLFLGVILTTAPLTPDMPETDHCGSCRRCLDVCPTNAFVAPYKLDARRCVSYLTIEHKGPIPRELRAGVGTRIFGCDDCLAVCPWNKFAASARDQRLAVRTQLDSPPLAELLELDEASFRQRFSGTPVRRTGYARFVRNVLVAAGNSSVGELLPAVESHLGNAHAIVRGAAVWAAARLAPADRFAQLANVHLADEHDPGVRSEWTTELDQ